MSDTPTPLQAVVEAARKVLTTTRPRIVGFGPNEALRLPAPSPETRDELGKALAIYDHANTEVLTSAGDTFELLQAAQAVRDEFRDAELSSGEYIVTTGLGDAIRALVKKVEGK